ncbi:hypothetical protein AGIG_G15577 [Arapaima gigas]
MSQLATSCVTPQTHRGSVLLEEGRHRAVVTFTQVKPPVRQRISRQPCVTSGTLSGVFTRGIDEKRGHLQSPRVTPTLSRPSQGKEDIKDSEQEALVNHPRQLAGTERFTLTLLNQVSDRRCKMMAEERSRLVCIDR